MSTALYRTYRPSRLDQVVGQDHVTGPLSRALENDRVHHAYLFSGPRGCGKTSTARILARSLNCEKGPTPDPCGECQSCVDLAAGGPGSIDVIELDAASHGGVDDARDLRDRAMFAPVSSRYKIYIIDEAHMVTTQGFNALLKLVEEPPEHVRFIFATTEADKVLATIRSRTHNYAFRLVPVKTLQDHLAGVCESEGIAADPAALALIARAGAGSVRDSLSLLGQVISGSGPEGVTYADAVVQLGMTDDALLDDTVDALVAQNGADLLNVIDRVVDAGHDPRRFVADLLQRLRDLIILQHVPEAASNGLIEGSADQIEREVKQAQAFGATELSRAADVVSAALGDLKGATAPRLQLELMAARLLLPAADDSQRGLGARIDQLERHLASGAVISSAASSPAPAPAKAAPSKPAPAQPSVPAPEVAEPEVAAAPSAPPKLSAVAPSSDPVKKDAAVSKPPVKKAPAAKKAVVTEGKKTALESTATLADFITMWPAILDALRTDSRVAWMIFVKGRPLSISNGTLAVSVDAQGNVKGAKDSGHDERLRLAILNTMHTDVKIDVVFDPDAAPIDANESDDDESDAPSADDQTVDDATGVELIMRELGGTTIGEIEN